MPADPHTGTGTGTGTDVGARVIVVGAGPAGLMAAEHLAASGCAVDVYDHMPSAGRKLLLAGRGGLNITHNEPIDRLLGRYGPARPRLEQALRGWDASALRAWCAGLGEPTFVGSSGRVFPSSFRATPLLRAWLARLAAEGVVLHVRHRLVGFGADARSVRLQTPTGVVERSADVVVLALGGASWPRVGSDGGWVEVLRGAGVEVAAMRPANCGLVHPWRDEFLARHEGAPVKNVMLRVAGQRSGVPREGGPGEGVRGDVVITTEGIEGGPVYALAAEVRDTIEREGSCTVLVDLHPDLSVDQLVRRLDARRPTDSTTTVLRKAAGLSPVAAALVRELAGRELASGSPELAQLVTSLPFVTHSTMPIDRAISSAGGVRLDEVDDSFMLRRLPGVFVAGEMLDWEAPTGGYLLQASFSTAVAAAAGAARWVQTSASYRAVAT